MFVLRALLGGVLLSAVLLAGLATLLAVTPRAEAVGTSGIARVEVVGILRHVNLVKVLATTCCEVLRIKTENVVR
ncbi:hypothetical protein GW916_09270 [bacterium]|uniref:Uncharacterized protein n=1 Tax=Candidatus Uhrbacteria bacterium CG22_combo_CG10-13_8_21_14_all_47_17 TaxID=1975041 RepID=A0A2H0BSC4_9BACT|nr:hypothetical protein [bacterium]PIP60577.1 MAG: hypothetical protein COX00_02515 [Candidatus Uhrbacteria bacterium CG22_combo_CG10-13_8_21_14_all_47_17]